MMDALDDDFEYDYVPQERARCKRCGNDRVLWLHVFGKGWRLHDNVTGELHTCSQAATDSDFEDLRT